MWNAGAFGTLDATGGGAAADCDLHGDCEHKDSGIVSRQPGILVHGERCANGFRDAVLAVASDFGGRGKMVSGLAMATKT